MPTDLSYSAWAGASTTGRVVSDRALWLEEWCPTCRAAPGTRCCSPYYRKTRPPTGLHVARGWRARTCPTCKATAGEPCRTPSGREGLAYPRGEATSRTARAARRRSGLAGTRSARRDDRDRPVQRARRTGRSNRQDRAESARRRESSSTSSVGRAVTSSARARGARLGSLRLVRRSAADCRNRRLDERGQACGDPGPTRRCAIRGARVTRKEGAPPRLTSGESARGPPAPLGPDTRKTGCHPVFHT